MSILIKGMEMPKSCWDCPMVSGYEIADEARTRYSTVRCRLTNTKRPVGEAIASDCPLVPVPPHGRLIDGDVAEVIHFTEEDADGKDFYDGILYAADFISKQPTIVPAEESET